MRMTSPASPYWWVDLEVLGIATWYSVKHNSRIQLSDQSYTGVKLYSPSADERVCQDLVLEDDDSRSFYMYEYVFRWIGTRFSLKLASTAINQQGTSPITTTIEALDTALGGTTTAVARIIGRPEKFVMVILKGSLKLTFGKNKEPAAFGELISMGGITKEVKRNLIATIGTILESKLSIPKERFILNVTDTSFSYNKSNM
ncbi:unnamed protein product [Lupinus luteus]|uniref:Uncharacterized protein n=1 Tax=Lupinus luteus TaxID=3873 RepID=A0AAV1XSV1_LUPLU